MSPHIYLILLLLLGGSVESIQEIVNGELNNSAEEYARSSGVVDFSNDVSLERSDYFVQTKDQTWQTADEFVSPLLRYADDIGDTRTDQQNLIFDELQGDACNSIQTCDACYGSRSCHWCQDGLCHTRGSVYGCFRGEICPKGPTASPSAKPPKPSKPTKAPSKKPPSCSDHKDCSDCARSSMFCHWCGFDNKCHAVGSIHGCATGVNCYNNKRCHRLQPEPKSDGFSAPPLLILYCMITSSIMIICCSCCFFGVRATKGAYEDLVINTAAATADVVLEQQSMCMSRGVPVQIGSTVRTTQLQPIEESGTEDGSKGSAREKQKSTLQYQTVEQWENLEDPTNPDENSSFTQTLLPKSSMLNRFDPAATRAGTILSRKSYRDSLQSTNTKCLLGCCTLIYIFGVLLTIGMSIGILMYFPRIPQYNVCNNEFDWKSIVEGMASAKIEAEFEILLSIYNPNRFGVDLVMGSGTFSHEGTYVGRFEIPPHTEIGKQSISDILVTITLKPDKWEALALTTEYYRGTLVFSVDTSVTVSAPALMGFTYPAKFADILVHVCDVSDDRSLCACPQWKDSKKPTFLEL